MRPVLEPTASPRTPEAVAAGDVVLRAALATVLALLALASAHAARVELPPTSAEVGRPLPFATATPPEARAWKGAEVAGGRLRVAARGANGAVATIEGGEGWRDYTVRAHLRWVGGRAVAVHVRETGPGDFIACVLDGRTARIDEVRDGVTRTLASAKAPAYVGRTFDAVVVVEGRRIGFAVQGRTLLTAEAGLRSGTAGLGAWDPAWDEAALEAEYVRVESGIAALAPASKASAAIPPLEDVDPGE